ncbi:MULTISPECIES: ABC transporter substrate-binding protein [Alteromonas]|jgi:branched-chain amino acid transport system substrate-binding protein|uniref:ABC transporter substrate-binding protein n=1 Tax=Alteromonas TaxID=226 RepID=UPI001930D3FD|nr:MULTISPECIES: ABC transporter substrate-binding protein [Alteromonas]|tara:strand:- start:6233 stop:7411 length:1179 start_codon:yes stop_codon:yes gene_type:complete
MRSTLFISALFCLFSLIIAYRATGAEEPLVVGIDADLSAVAVEGGKAISRGVELAVDEINAAGGILGRKIRIIAKDHRGNPSRGVFNIEQFAKMPNVLAVVGGVHTPVVLAEIDIIHTENMLMLVPWAAGTAIVDNGYEPNNVFRVSVRDAEAASVLIDHAKQKGLSNVALVLERTAWGRSNLESLNQAANASGVTITSIHWINWQQKDFSEDIAAIKSGDAEGIILVTNVPEGVVVVDEMAKQNVASLPVISHWGIASGQFISALANPTAGYDISVLQTFHFSHQKNRKAKQLLDAYYGKYGLIDIHAIGGVTGLAHAYDLIHLLAAAADKAGSIETDKLRQGLESLENIEGAVKNYDVPFTAKRHDALWSKDYFMTKYNEKGHLVTVGQK